jgi:lipoprotein-releasing system ATP-binding protein
MEENNTVQNSTGPLLQVTGVDKVFSISGKELPILQNISFDLQVGEMAALMGPSGVGKSTLLHILGTLDRPSSGQVLYEGQDVFRMNDDDLARFRSRTVGFVFQFHHLLPEFNTLENTFMPSLIAGENRYDSIKKAKQLLGDVGLGDRVLHKPGELSGGEQQRVAVARALMLDPKVVLADEPTGNLDTRTGEELFNLLSGLNKRGITFIIVTHNDVLASQCSRMIRMKDGRII